MRELQLADARAREIALYGPSGAPVVEVPPTLDEATWEAYRAAESAGRTDLLDKMVVEFISILEDASRYGDRP